MNNFKNNIKANFTAVPNFVSNDQRLSWKAKGIFLYLASKPNDWQFYMNEIKKNATDGKTSLQTGIKELEELGYLIRKKSVDGNNQFNGWDWILTIPDNQEIRLSGSPSVRQSDSRKTPSHTKTDSTNKELTKKESKSVYAFDGFWDDYDDKKERSECEKKWNKLSEDDKELIKEFIPIYQAHEPDKQYRKNPLTFLNSEIWKDDWEAYPPKENDMEYRPQYLNPVTEKKSRRKQSSRSFAEKLDRLDELNEVNMRNTNRMTDAQIFLSRER